MADHKWISGLTADTPLADAARRALGVRLETVRDNISPAIDHADEDIEHVHQLRVATRRATAALDIFAVCLPEKTVKHARKSLRRLRRAAGAARDWDVFLLLLEQEKKRRTTRYRPGIDFLTGYALGHRAAAQESLAEAGHDHPFALDRLLSETLSDIRRPNDHHAPRSLGELARELLQGLVDDLERSGAGNVHDYQDLHRVRIVGKRLRYAIEVVADCFVARLRDRVYPVVEDLQEILGNANDSHLAQTRLSAVCARLQAKMPADWRRLRPGVEGFLHWHEARAAHERENYLAWRRRWKRMVGSSKFT